MKEIILKVEGMSCGGCENRVQNAVKTIEGVEEVVADHVNCTVTVKANNVDKNIIKEKIEDLGYNVVE